MPVDILLCCMGWLIFSQSTNCCRKRGTKVDSYNSDGRQFVSIRAYLLILLILFFCSLLQNELWRPINMDMLPNLFMTKNIDSTVINISLNPIVLLIDGNPLMFYLLRHGTLLLEGLFWTVLFSRRALWIFIPVILILHSINALWLDVTFFCCPISLSWLNKLPILTGLIWPKPMTLFEKVPCRVLVYFTFISALFFASLWNADDWLSKLFHLGGLIDWWILWCFVLPFAVFWLEVSLLNNSVTAEIFTGANPGWI